MLLGALVGAGVPLEVLQDAVDAVVARAGHAARRAGHPRRLRRHPRATSRSPTRCSTAPGATSAPCSSAARRRGARPRARVFERLAVAEARVHGTTRATCTSTRSARSTRSPTSSACAPGFVHLGRRPRSWSRPSRSARARSSGAHGPLPVPPPAVAELLRGVPSYAGPAARREELCTPTGAALLTTLATAWGPQPAMTAAADRRRRRRPRPRGACQRAAAARRRARQPASDGQRRPAAARDQRRRPRPAGVAVGHRRAARRPAPATPG